MTVTSGLHRQKDKERQRKTEENVDRRPVVAPEMMKEMEVMMFIAKVKMFLAGLTVGGVLNCNF